MTMPQMSPRPDHSTIPSVPRRALPSTTPLLPGLLAKRFPNPPPAFVLRAVTTLRRWLLTLADKLVPAHVAVFIRVSGHIQTALLGVVARYGVADLLANGPLTAEEIARRTGCDADAMYRILRGLAGVGIFRLRDGRFENNRLSRTLVSGQLHRTREWVQYSSSQSNLYAWVDLDGTLRTGDNAFERLFGMSIWDWFERFPDEREMFANAMMGITVSDAPVVATLYPFGEVKTLCDVGGGRGTLLSEILLRHPHLRGVLCDAAGVLESARPLLAERGVADRVELQPGNFFQSVPSGADAYLLKNILHDWDDERCRVILRTVRKAMQPGQRLLVVEMLVPHEDERSFGALADLQMMVVCSNGRERSREELERLLAESGFRASRVFAFPTVGVVEGIAV